MTPGEAYQRAGVDRSRARETLDRIAGLVRGTHGERVLGAWGSFGGSYALGPAGETVLVASVDGVGTKTRLAGLLDRWEVVGYDIVSHGANDVLVQGAEPLFFLDYLAMGRLEPEVLARIVAGMTEACREAGCALLGGETAEMPDVYGPGDVEIVGTMVGQVPREHWLDGSRVRPGDLVVGLPSNGLHTNGFSLVRRIFGETREVYEEVPPPLEVPLGEALLRPHRMYLGFVRPLLQRPGLHAMAHVTGGGLAENLARVLPAGVGARLRRSSWDPPAVFRVIAERGRVEAEEMYRVFNMGVGWVMIMEPREAHACAGGGIPGAWILGEIVAGSGVVWSD
jgi:phosphoribosylformylglycinamidine cyclo-ligase